MDGEFLIWSSEISINDILNQLLRSDDEKQGNGLYDIGLLQQDELVGIDYSGSGVLFNNPKDTSADNMSPSEEVSDGYTVYTQTEEMEFVTQ